MTGYSLEIRNGRMMKARKEKKLEWIFNSIRDDRMLFDRKLSSLIVLVVIFMGNDKLLF